jgi:hypothetical protein
MSDPRKMSDEEVCRELARISLHEAKPGSVHVLLEAIERLRSRARTREALENIVSAIDGDEDEYDGYDTMYSDDVARLDRIARRALEESE